jgi:pimeloyl-ACP methyl ester carboxylesterase
VRDLDEEARARFAARAIASPGRLATDVLRLTDERRYEVPATAICPEYTPEQLRAWIDAGEPAVQEFAKIREVDYVDLPTGHWPQFTAPKRLTAAIAAAAQA